MSRLPPTTKPSLIVRRGWTTTLRFKHSVTQSQMLTLWPDRLQVGYTRTMLAALLLQPQPARIGILGLGGGSQAKFCHRWLPDARIEACEANADVLALREVFHIPPDSERFRSVHADAARLIRQRHAAYELLLLDAYDAHGIPEALSGQNFYDDCRDALSADGVLAVNLYSTTARRHITKLRHSFHDRVVVLDEPHMSNRVVFAWREQARAHPLKQVLAGLPWSPRWQLRQGLRRLAAAVSQH